jgi:methylenetetrahydrofolate dehydrogenase (NADP+) / methenyltetrahydrofolate cyclohydrolase
MTKIIDGKKLAERIKDRVAKEIFKMKSDDRPNLAIVLVGDRSDSELYVQMKEREGKKVGVDTHLYKCEESISEKELLETIEHLNNDIEIDAILIQLPLPDSLNTNRVIAAINPEKDVDFFHPDNLKILQSTCNHNHAMSPVYKTILAMVESIDYDLSNTKTCVLCNSDVFGESLIKVLDCLGAKTTVAHIEDDDWQDKLKTAEFVITAIGKPHFIKKGHLKKDSVVIDVGTTKKGKKILGDVDFDDVDEHVSYISPVPGGVGPMTIAMLFENVLEMYKKKVVSIK